MFSEEDDAFLMYAVSGRTWVAMGGPYGPNEQRRELAWRFRERAARHGGHVAFYEVGAEDLPILIDMGCSLFKLGEEARIPLAGFSLSGRTRKDLRRNRNRAEKAGCSFGIVPPADVPDHLADLRAISDEWLAEKDAAENGFSVGHFDESYLKRFPIAVVRHEGDIIAFANIWRSSTEISPDLMRYRADAPKGVMDYLFVNLIDYGQREGYEWLSLGMAPLSGLEDRPLAPLWNHIGAGLFRHGEAFYNYRGVRE